MDPGLSDHISVCGNVFIPKPEPIIETRYVRNTKDIDHDALSNDLSSLSFKSSCPDELADLYNFSVSNVFDSHAPKNDYQCSSTKYILV